MTKRQKKFTPEGYNIALTERQATELVEILRMPGFKVLQRVLIAQRKDHIARKALATAASVDQMQFYRGQAAELQTLMVVLKNIKKKFDKQEEADQDNGLDGVETVKDY